MNEKNNSTQRDVSRFFYASSACIYPENRQLNTEIEGGGLKEEHAWPAQVGLRISKAKPLHIPEHWASMLGLASGLSSCEALPQYHEHLHDIQLSLSVQAWNDDSNTYTAINGLSDPIPCAISLSGMSVDWTTNASRWGQMSSGCQGADFDPHEACRLNYLTLKCALCSLKMLMDWRSWPARSWQCTTTRTLALSAGWPDSTTFLGPTGPGRAGEKRHQQLSAER